MDIIVLAINRSVEKDVEEKAIRCRQMMNNSVNSE